MLYWRVGPRRQHYSESVLPLPPRSDLIAFLPLLTCLHAAGSIRLRARWCVSCDARTKAFAGAAHHHYCSGACPRAGALLWMHGSMVRCMRMHPHASYHPCACLTFMPCMRCMSVSPFAYKAVQPVGGGSCRCLWANPASKLPSSFTRAGLRLA